MDGVAEEEVLQLMLEGKSHSEISNILNSRFSHIPRGLSERSVRRFIVTHGLRVKHQSKVEEQVRVASREVSTYIHYVL